jgi:hypothetical protein
VARLDLVLLYPAAIHVPRAHSQVRLGVAAAVLQRIDVLIRTGSDLLFDKVAIALSNQNNPKVCDGKRAVMEADERIVSGHTGESLTVQPLALISVHQFSRSSA